MTSLLATVAVAEAELTTNEDFSEVKQIVTLAEERFELRLYYIWMQGNFAQYTSVLSESPQELIRVARRAPCCGAWGLYDPSGTFSAKRGCYCKSERRGTFTDVVRLPEQGDYLEEALATWLTQAGHDPLGAVLTSSSYLECIEQAVANFATVCEDFRALKGLG